MLKELTNPDTIGRQTTKTETKKRRVDLDVKVTPQIAAAWLDVNTNNRPKQAKTIIRIARDMKAGGWRKTAETIKFDTNGRLIDGQHRLEAVILADVTVEMDVAYNCPPDAQEVLDTGRVRTPANMLSMLGVPNATSVAVAMRHIAWERNGNTSRDKISHAEFSDLMTKHRRLPEYVPSGGALPRGISGGMVGAMYYLAVVHLRKRERGEAMIKVLREGVPDYPGCAMHRFRERFMAAAQAGGSASGDVRQLQWQALKHAWNFFAEKKPMQAMRPPREFVELDGIKRSDL